jgi:hypothetical protein
MLARCPPRLKPPTFASIWIASRFASLLSELNQDRCLARVHSISAWHSSTLLFCFTRVQCFKCRAIITPVTRSIIKEAISGLLPLSCCQNGQDDHQPASGRRFCRGHRPGLGAGLHCQHAGISRCALSAGAVVVSSTLLAGSLTVVDIFSGMRDPLR